jgi:hypothetical protein
MTLKVLTSKDPAEQALIGFVPPVLKMNENAAAPSVYDPDDPKGVSTVIV